jgi:4-hydroxy-tetrahydrodipicolinate synthase
MVTPFDAEEKLDLDGSVALARHLVASGSDALVVAGTTGEGSVLSDAEKLALFEAVAGAVSAPVIANTGSNDTAHSVELTREASRLGVAGILAVTPYYSRPSQEGIAAHFRAIAEVTTLPVLVYDIPVRTGRRVARETMLGLAREVANIVGVKDAAGDVAGSARLIAEAPAGFELLSGDDSLTLALLAQGASGVVGVATHWAGREHQAMISAFLSGDVERARRVQSILLESFRFETSEATPNPLPAKAMLRVLGLPAGQCRAPMGPAPAGLDEAAAEVLDRLAAASAALGIDRDTVGVGA